MKNVETKIDKPIICIIGPSGSGKTTLVSKYSDKYLTNMIVSHTTREPRNGEINGFDYYFVDEDEYNNLNLVEAVEYNNAKYGLSKDEVEDKLMRLGDTVAVVTYEGYKHLKECYETIPVYLDVSEETQVDRLVKRGDPEHKIKERLALRKKDVKSLKKVLEEGGCVIDADRDVLSIVSDLVKVSDKVK